MNLSIFSCNIILFCIGVLLSLLNLVTLAFIIVFLSYVIDADQENYSLPSFTYLIEYFLGLQTVRSLLNFFSRFYRVTLGRIEISPPLGFAVQMSN